ncbi:hypothetical protein GETHED_07750 [Geothrix edaphica]|uniref:Uncharacterized protein n=1 Tax=Geothrix edaphica TaxID=2927976 RepID=A0ABQ5PW91_9BACT|nr:hypothetical protein GETHED_07750 [Geothrix edaphica]
MLPASPSPDVTSAFEAGSIAVINRLPGLVLWLAG